MKMAKDFSVIIPAYDEEKLIEKTLLSVKNQKFIEGIEIIVVDNNSTDRTSEIAKRYADKVLFFDAIQGASAARNHGARNAQGKYLAFLDADTILSSNALSEAEKSLKEGHSGGVAKIITPHKSILAESQVFILNTWERFLGPIYTPYIYTTQKNFVKSGRWDEHIELGEEVRFLRKLKRFGPLAYNDLAYVETSPRRYLDKGYISITLKGILGWAGFNMRWKPIR